MGDNNNKQNDNQPKEKVKTFTEQEVLKRITDAFEENTIKEVSYKIDNRMAQRVPCPRLNYQIDGGDPVKLRLLGIKIERLIIDYAESTLVS